MSAYEDLKKKLIKNGATDTSKSASSYQELKAKLRSNGATFEGDMSEGDIRVFMNDTQKYLSGVEDDANSLIYDNARATYEKYKTSAFDLANRASQVKGWYNENKKNISKEDYDSMMEYLDAFRSNSQQALDYFSKSSDYYSQFKNAEEYANASKPNYVMHEVPNQYKGYENQPDFEKYANQREFGNPTAKDAYSDGATPLEIQMGNASALEIPDKLGAYLGFAENQKMAVGNTTADISDSLKNKLQNGMNIGSETQKLNGLTNDLKLDAYDNYTVQRYNQGANLFDNMLKEGSNSYWEELDDNEIGIYYYLLNTEGQESAYKFLDDMRAQLGQRHEFKVSEAYEEANALEKLALNMVAVPARTLGGSLGFAEDVYNMAMGNERNPYSEAHRFQNFGEMVTANNANAINEWSNNVKIPWVNIGLGELYQFGQSAIDSLFGAHSLGKAYTVFMGMGAASTKAKQLYEQGFSEEQIVAGAFASGLTETLTEYISMDHFLNGNIEKPLKYALAQAGVEASEEAIAEISNIITDAINLKDKSEWAKDMKEGGFWNAFSNALGQVVSAGIGGFVSGGAMSGAQVGINAIGNTMNAHSTGKKLFDNSGIHALVNTVENDRGSYNKSTLKALDKAKASLAKGDNNLSGRDYTNFGRLSNKYESNVRENALKAAMGEKLGELNSLDNRVDSKTIDKLYEYMTSNADLKLASKEIRELANYLEGSNLTEVMKANIDDAYNGVAAKHVEVKREKALEQKYESKVSKSGNAVDITNDETVNIGKIASLDSNGMTLATDNGKTINANNIEYKDATQAHMYETLRTLGTLGMTTESANYALEAINNMDINKSVAMSETQLAFHYGITNQLNSLENLSIPQEYAKAIYEAGRQASKTNAKAMTERALGRKATSAKTSEGVHILQGSTKEGQIDVEALKNPNNKSKQKAVYEVAKFLQKNSALDIYLFQSYQKTDKDGKVRNYRSTDGKEMESGSNGWYNPGTNKIYIDLNAGNDFSGLGLFTLSHEISHYIRDWNAEAWQDMADYIVEMTDKLYEEGKADLSFSDNEVLKYQKYKEFRDAEADGYAGKSDTELKEMAYEDVICDSLSFIMSEKETFVEMTDRIKQKDQKLWNRIKTAIKNFLDRIGKWLESYKDVKAENAGQAIQAATEIHDTLREMYLSAFEGANKNFMNAVNNAEMSEDLQTMQEAGVNYDEETGTVFVESQRYSYASDNLANVDRDELVASIMAVTGMSKTDVDEFLRAEENASLMVKGTSLDFEANDKEVAIKKNTDYPQGTIDITNICTKRAPITRLTSRLQSALPEDLFTADDYADIRLILMDDKRVVACGLCFVEDRRQLLGEITKLFMDEWAKALKNGTNLKKTNASGVEKDVMIGEDLAKRYGVKPGKIKPSQVTFRQEMFTVPENWYRLQKQRPEIAAAYEAYNNARGQQAGRLLLDRAEYKREILSWTPEEVKKVNDVGGLRIFSFSDFEVIHLVDLLQIIIDCAAKGVKIQGYTKQTAFAKLVSKTGIKLNRSFIPYGATGIKIVNGKKVLAIDTKEGIDNEDENFLDETDNPNVGNNITGINDEQIHLAMVDNFFHYIIPFHTNKAGKTNNKLGVGKWTNYKPYQTDKQASSAEDIATVFNLKAKYMAQGMEETKAYAKALLEAKADGIKFENISETKMVNIYTDVLPYVNNEKEFVEKYLEVCAERDIVPRYPQFLKYDEEEGFQYTEGYSKFLVDFKLFNYETGEILPQELVTPNFKEGDIQKLIADELAKTKDAKDNEYPEELYNNILNYIKVKHGYNGDKKAYEEYKKIVKDTAEKSNRDENGTDGMAVSPSALHSDRDASLTTERIDYIIDDYGASIPNYAQAYVARISPRDFLKLTLSDDRLDMWNADEGANPEIYALDREKLKGNSQTPFLTIEDGEVVGHEGRHRMRALMNAGVESVPVVIREMSTKYSKTKMPSMTLRSQDFGDGNVNNGAEATITDLIPTNKIYRDELIEKYGQNDSAIKFSDRVTNPKTLRFLNDQLKKGEVTEVYRAMQVVEIDGEEKLVPPMAGKVAVKQPNGKNKWVWQNPSEIGEWESSTEITDFDKALEQGIIEPTKYKDGREGYNFKLKKGSGGTDVPAAYNPYIHTSLSSLNDQFTSAYKRPNLRIVKGYVPNSELTSGYRAKYAKDSVGRTQWHSGVVAPQMPEAREVILSRYFMPIEIMKDSDVAKAIKEQMQGRDIEIPYNVVSPGLRKALEDIGVRIGEGQGLANLPPKDSVKYSDRAEVELGTLFSGADTFAYAINGFINTQFAAENRPDIVGVYKMNHGGIVFEDVLKIDPKNMPKIQHLQVSPPCINLSAMNNDRGEKPIDRQLATKVAEIISTVKPRAVTIENVEGYATSESMNIIRNALKKSGYKSVDIGVYKDSEYGGYTTRERVILRAMRDEELPPIKGKVAKAKGWGEAVGMDFLKSLPDAKNINPRMVDSLKKYNGINPYKINRPLLVFGESYKNKQFGHAFFNQSCPTIIAESGASRIFMPDGTVKECTPEVLAKIMGIDGFKLPDSKVLARRVIGNGIPAAITENVMGPLIEKIHADNEERIAKGEQKLYSERDTRYMELAKNPEKNRAELQKVVAEAAKEAGYDSPLLFHGTTQFGFTTIDTDKSDDKFSFFATDSEVTAKSYSYDAGKRDIRVDTADYEAEFNEASKKFHDAINDLVSTINQEAGIYNFLDHTDATKKVEELLVQNHTKEGWADAVTDLAMFDWFYEAYYNANDSYDGVEDYTDDFFDDFIEPLITLGNAKTHAEEVWNGADTPGGLYSLYANTNNLLTVDANGANWSRIGIFEFGGKFNEWFAKKHPEYSNQRITSTNTRLLAEYAKDSGYAGVRIDNVKDDGGRGTERVIPASVYIFFNPQEQVKSADPVTYDDDGNVIPLSERFNEKNADIRYSDRDLTITKKDRKNYALFKEEIANIPNKSNNEALKVLNNTPKILQRIGMEDKAIFMTVKHYNDIIHPESPTNSNWHGLTTGQVNKAPVILWHPAIIADSNSRNDSVIVISDILDNKNRPIIISIFTDGEGRYGYEMEDSNFMTSMYGRKGFNSFITSLVNDNKILYIDRKKAHILYRNLGVQFPLMLTQLSFDNIIQQSNNIVKENIYTKYLRLSARPWENKNRLRTLLNEEASKKGYSLIVDAFGKEKYFDGKNYRSAKLVAYDNSGNVTPLNKRFSDRTDYLDTKKILAEDIANLTDNKVTAKHLTEYQDTLKRIEDEKQKLADANAKWDELHQVEKAKRDRKAIHDVNETITKAKNNILTLNNKLTRIEGYADVKELLGKIRKGVVKEIVKESNERELEQQKNEILDKYNIRLDKRKATEFRNRVKKYVEDFRQRLLHPTANSYIPSRLASAVIDIFDSIDTTGRAYYLPGTSEVDIDRTREEYRPDSHSAQKYKTAKEALADLKLAYDALTEEDFEFSYEFDQEFSKNIAKLAEAIGDKPLREMNTSQLEDVYIVLHDIAASITDATKQIGTSEAITNYQAGQEIIDDMYEVRDKGIHTNKISSFFREWTLNPMRAVREMSGFKEDARLVKLFDDLNEGRRKADAFAMEANKEFAKLLNTKEGIKAFNDAVEKASVDVGNGIKISKMQAMQAILTYEREIANKNRKHLESPVLFTDVAYDVKGNYSKAFDNGHEVVVDADFVERVQKQLSDWDQKYMELARHFFRETSKDAINSTMIQLKHRIVANEKNYVPYYVNADYLATEAESVKFDATIEGMGILKSVVNNAPQQLVIRGLNSIIDDHIGKVAKIYGLAIPVKNFNKAINMKQTKEAGGIPVKVAIRDTWNQQGLDLVIDSVAEMYAKKPKGNALLGAIKSGFVESTLAGNISVWMKQAASYPTAGAYLSTMSLTKALPYFLRKMSSIYEEIDAHTPQHYTRRIGLSTQELGDMNQSHGWEKRLNKRLGKFSPMNWIQAMDVKTTAVLWQACKYDVEAKGIKPGADNYWDEVTDLYNKVIEETQPMYDSLHRAKVTKDDQLRNFIMFQTQPLQNSGILRDGAMRYKSAKKMYGKDSVKAKEALKLYRKAVESQLASHFVFTLMTLVSAMILHKMNRYRDDDKEVTMESMAEEFFKQWGENYAGAVIPIFGSYGISFAEKVFDDSRYDVLSDPTVDKINSTLNTFAGLKQPSFQAYLNVAHDVASYFGIPTQNIYNIGNGLYQNAMDALNGDLGEFEYGVERTQKQDFHRSYEAYQSGDMDKFNSIEVAQSTVTRYLKPQFLEAYKKNDTETMTKIRRYMKAVGVYKEDVVSVTQQWIKQSAK